MKNVFDDLLSLKDAAKLWHLEESTIRKAIANNRFAVGKDVKKFGKQWVITKSAMEEVYGLIFNDDIFVEHDKTKVLDIYYFIFECFNAYAKKYKKTVKVTNKEFENNNIYEYIYECFDYLHLVSVNDNVIDIRFRIKRGIKYD